MYAGNIERHLAELAHRYLEAAPSGEAREAIEYACRAAERSAALLAYEEATSMPPGFQRAIHARISATRTR
jgi:hypothetical protein